MMLLVPVMGILSGCNAEVPPPTAEGFLASYADAIHRTGQNEFKYIGDTSNGRGVEIAQSYCKATLKNGFANITLDYDGLGYTAFQCFPEGAHLVPTYPRAALVNNTIIQH
jgi:hypothetical protein